MKTIANAPIVDVRQTVHDEYHKEGVTNDGKGNYTFHSSRSKEQPALSKAAKALNLGKTHGRTPSKTPDDKSDNSESEIVFRFTGDAETVEFGEFGMALYQYDINRGKRRLSEIKATTIRCFLGYTQGKDLPIKDIDSDFIERFEEFLLEEKGLTRNTSSFYLRNTRVIYNQAVKYLGIKDRDPFREVFTGVAKTVKRAIGIDCIRKINKLDLSKEPSLAFARDMFILSFMLRGISFIDMAFLKVTDLQNGTIHYQRKKTGQGISIKYEQPMEKIFKRRVNITRPEYILPIIVKKDVDDIRQYRTMLYEVNKSLKTIGERIDAEVPLTMYVARHSWATVAKDMGIPIRIISEGMGHSSESTTLVYLGQIGKEQVDNANKRIISSL